MDTTEQQEQWLEIDQAAELTGYAFEHLRRLIRLGKLHAQKRQGRWIIPESELLAYVESVKQGRKPRPTIQMAPTGLRLWFPRPHARTPSRIKAEVNGVACTYSRLDMEYPKSNDERLADIAPATSGFYTISVRALVTTIRWMEQQFVNGQMIIVVPRNGISVAYSKPVDFVCETVEPSFTGSLSAAFGFYKAHVELIADP